MEEKLKQLGVAASSMLNALKFVPLKDQREAGRYAAILNAIFLGFVTEGGLNGMDLAVARTRPVFKVLREQALAASVDLVQAGEGLLSFQQGLRRTA